MVSTTVNTIIECRQLTGSLCQVHATHAARITDGVAGDLRLTWDNQVQIYTPAGWAGHCIFAWQSANSDVACRELGYGECQLCCNLTCMSAELLSHSPLLWWAHHARCQQIMAQAVWPSDQQAIHISVVSSSAREMRIDLTTARLPRITRTTALAT
jgi:hypothetical protein